MLQERQRFGDGTPALDDGARLPDLLRTQAARTPDAVAVVDEQSRLTFAELFERAGAVAGRLRALGVGPDRVVGLHAQRSVDMVVALLGIVLADGAYLPLDPDWPASRLGYLVGEARPVAVLSGGPVPQPLPATCPVLDLAGAGNGAAGTGAERAAERWPPHDSDLVYVIYTSGSTGQPKGVAMPHRGLVNRLRWMRERYRPDRNDAVLHKTPLTFDVSAWEVFLPLMTGARLVVARPGGHRDPAYLGRLMAREGITIVHFVPSMLALFLDGAELAGCTALRLVVASGEALSPALANAFAARHPAQLHNLYGPTEAAIDVTQWQCRAVEPGPTVPIGRPITGVRVRVLDERQREVPDGQPGELYLGGVCLARGYLGRDDLTRRHFIPDPSRPGERLYRTGDQVRWTEDGQLEFLGRLDDQVKLRGVRIELGEVEAAALTVPGVVGAVAMVRDDVRATPKLVLYVVGGADGPPLERVVRRHLADRLPDAMLPSLVVALDRLPLTENGKCDRRRLPRPS